MTGKILTFYLCGYLFGIDIKFVKEIIRNIEFNQIPGTQPHIAGLFNMRGQIVTVLDLAVILSYPETLDKKNSACIILKLRQGDLDFVGLLMDRPDDVVDIESEWCEPPPANFGEAEIKYLKEVVKLKDMLVMIIDPDMVTGYN